jgi:hypothetical protein
MAFLGLLLLTVLPLSAMAGNIGKELADLGELSFFYKYNLIAQSNDFWKNKQITSNRCLIICYLTLIC